MNDFTVAVKVPLMFNVEPSNVKLAEPAGLLDPSL